ncbi:hypothetical protein CV102_25560 [Natronococcus pandeyae]|uniref:Restriction endonuclease type IV Mrr domain-containing protein n=1 Tax=Natronococcus pandeyae TaxID=2055836 RepID=A0A8J8TMQ9_9EURY|nr:restriction endonuclease [Natronococcus pandeyae]TYL35856.1 hypothetical protein CV102_25560 [Natronococcus pandeyae]
MDPNHFLSFAQEVSSESYTNENDFAYIAANKFCRALGIDTEHLFYEVMISESRFADAVIAPSRTSKPWVILEFKTIGDDSMVNLGLVEELRSDSDAEVGVALRPNSIGVTYENDRVMYVLSTLNEGEAGILLDILSPPEDYFDEKDEEEKDEEDLFGVNISNVDSDKYKFDRFKIDVDGFIQAVREVENAETNQEKGDTFEDLAKILFNALDNVVVRDTNVKNNTGEVDLIVEYLGSDDLTIFDDWGRYFLVECKNWKDSVGVSEIRDFYGKMDKTKVDLGIIFARNGISGDNGVNAKRWIQDYYQRDSCMILVISEEHIRLLLEGESDLYSTLDDEMYKRKFSIIDGD